MSLLTIFFLLAPQTSTVPQTFQAQLGLQERIDRAAPGSTIVVAAGYWPPIRIDKPLTFVGEDGAVIYSDRPYGTDPFPAPITLDGPGYGQVRLVNLTVGGYVDGHVFSCVAGAIVGGGFEALELYQCDVRAPSYWRWHLLCAGGPGISVHVPRVLLVGSIVLASAGISDCCFYAPGAAGIEGPYEVELLYGSFAGGAAFVDPCTRFYCPDQSLMQLATAPGIRASCVYKDGTSGFSGSGGQLWRTFDGTFDCYFGSYTDCGYGPYGPGFEKTGDCYPTARRR